MLESVSLGVNFALLHGRHNVTKSSCLYRDHVSLFKHQLYYFWNYVTILTLLYGRTVLWLHSCAVLYTVVGCTVIYL